MTKKCGEKRQAHTENIQCGDANEFKQQQEKQKKTGKWAVMLTH